MKSNLALKVFLIGSAAAITLLCFTPVVTWAQVSIAIGPGSTLAVDGDMEIVVRGNWTNSGTFVAGSGEVVFNGTQNQTITNTSGENFNDVTVNKSAGDLLLNDNATVAGNLILTDGDIDLNGNTLTLNTNALLTETSGNTVKGLGQMVTTRNLNAPSGLNVAGMGFEMTTSINLGSTVISRMHDEQTINGMASILRYFDVTPTNNSGLNATLLFHYDDSELNGRTETGLFLFRSIDSGSNWTSEGGTVNTGNNTISLSSIDEFSRWAATSVGTPGLVFRVERSTGDVFADGSFIPGGADLAERIQVSEPVEPGDVVELDPNRPEHYRKARGSSQLVAGVITTDPGFTLGNSPDEKQSDIRPMLALMGRVPVKATAENGPIRPGDLLTISSKPGYAMRCAEIMECVIIGKALAALPMGEGMVLVLVMAH